METENQEAEEILRGIASIGCRHDGRVIVISPPHKEPGIRYQCAICEKEFDYYPPTSRLLAGTSTI